MCSNGKGMTGLTLFLISFSQLHQGGTSLIINRVTFVLIAITSDFSVTIIFAVNNAMLDVGIRLYHDC